MASRLWSCASLEAGIQMVAPMDASAPPASDLQARIEATCHPLAEASRRLNLIFMQLLEPTL